MMTLHYVLFNLETNEYLRTVGMLTKDYRLAKSFDEKDDALLFLKEGINDISLLGKDWTTREFIVIIKNDADIS